jgi:hypothetical protein
MTGTAGHVDYYPSQPEIQQPPCLRSVDDAVVSLLGESSVAVDHVVAVPVVAPAIFSPASAVAAPASHLLDGMSNSFIASPAWAAQHHHAESANASAALDSPTQTPSASADPAPRAPTGNSRVAFGYGGLSAAAAAAAARLQETELARNAGLGSVNNDGSEPSRSVAGSMRRHEVGVMQGPAGVDTARVEVGGDPAATCWEPRPSFISRLVRRLRVIIDFLIGFDQVRPGDPFSTVLRIAFLSVLPYFIFGIAIGATKLYAVAMHRSSYNAVTAFVGRAVVVADTPHVAPSTTETIAVYVIVALNIVWAIMNLSVGVWCRVWRVYPEALMIAHLWASSVISWILIELSHAFPGDSVSTLLALVSVAAGANSWSCRLLAALNVLACILYRVNERFDNVLRPWFADRALSTLDRSVRIVYFLEDVSIVFVTVGAVAACLSHVARQYLNAHGVAVLARRVAAFAATYDMDAFRAELDCYAAGARCETQLLQNHRLLLAHLERFGAHLPHYIPENSKPRKSSADDHAGDARSTHQSPLGKDVFSSMDVDADHATVDADGVEAACAYGVSLAEWCQRQQASRSLTSFRGAAPHVDIAGACASLSNRRKTVAFRLDAAAASVDASHGAMSQTKVGRHAWATKADTRINAPGGAVTDCHSPPKVAASRPVPQQASRLPMLPSRTMGRHMSVTRINLTGTPLGIAAASATSPTAGVGATAAECVALQWFHEYGTFMAQLIAAVGAADGALASAIGDAIFISWNAAVTIANPEAQAARFMVYAAHTLVPELNDAVVRGARGTSMRRYELETDAHGGETSPDASFILRRPATRDTTVDAADIAGGSIVAESDLPIELPRFSFCTVTGRAHCFYAGDTKQVFATVSLGGCRVRFDTVSAFADRFGHFSTAREAEICHLEHSLGTVDSETAEGFLTSRSVITRAPVILVDAATHAAIRSDYLTLPVGVLPEGSSGHISFGCGSASTTNKDTGMSRGRNAASSLGVARRSANRGHDLDIIRTPTEPPHVFTPDSPWAQFVLYELVQYQRDQLIVRGSVRCERVERALRFAAFHTFNKRPLEALRQLQRCHQAEPVPVQFRAFHFFKSTLEAEVDNQLFLF